MAIKGGYNWKILRVDLTEQKIAVEDFDEKFAEKWVGGSGFGARILYDETKPETDPLGPENLLMFMTGPLAGSRVPTSGRHEVIAKSPLTGIYGESNCGGSWGVEFKQAGFDGIVFGGKAEKPLYLWVHNGKAELRDASHLWGKTTYEVDELLKKETNASATTAIIGPAGEKGVKVAGITHNGKHSRMAARAGLGCVMASKNLKAVVARGTQKVPIADEEGLRSYTKSLYKHIMESTATFGKFGTPGGVVNYEKMGNLPLRNWAGSRWGEDHAFKIGGQNLYDTILTGRTACRHCPIACGRQVKVESGPFSPVEGEGPEYETLGTIGSLCLIDNLEAVSYANQICNQYGMDTISVGGIVAFAMECYERGILTKEDTGGVELRFGDPHSMVECVKLIAERRHVGELLGEGVRKAAQVLGRGSEEFAVHSKGLEFPAHDPRCFWSLALGYSTSNRGACHLQGWTHPYELALHMDEFGFNEVHERHTTDRKDEFVFKLQNYMSIMDSIILCRFIQLGKAANATNKKDWLNYVTGRELSMDEYMLHGERIFNLKRMYNVRLGLSRKDDTLPPRILTHKRKGDDIVSALPPFNELLSNYYAYRGWDEEGIPKREKLMELGLEDLIPDLPW